MAKERSSDTKAQLCCSVISRTAEPNFFEVGKTCTAQRASVLMRDSANSLRGSRCQTSANESLTPFNYHEYVRVNTQTTENNDTDSSGHGRFSLYLKRSGLVESRSSLFLNARETTQVVESVSQLMSDRFLTSGKQFVKAEPRVVPQRSSAFLDAVKRDPPVLFSTKTSIWKHEPVHCQQKLIGGIRKLY